MFPYSLSFYVLVFLTSIVVVLVILVAIKDHKENKK